MNLHTYLKKFKKLNVNHAEKNKKGSVAPHKPILLLSVIKLIEDGVIRSPRIYLTPELISTFKNYWEQLANSKYHREIALPFFYLKSDDFWKLVPKLGQQEALMTAKGIKTIGQLNARVSHAEIDEPLFQLLQGADERGELRQVLLDTYLDYNKSNFSEAINYYQYIQAIEDIMVQEDFEAYYTRLQQIRTRVKQGSPAREQAEEEEFIRSAQFPSVILRLYNYACCVSRLQVTMSARVKRKVSMVEGCHIEPFHVNGNNSVNNGISFTYTIHKAFDKGLIAISDDYKVIVNKNFQEDTSSPYNLSQFDNQPILLPNNPQYYPSRTALKEHRSKFGFWG